VIEALQWKPATADAESAPEAAPPPMPESAAAPAAAMAAPEAAPPPVEHVHRVTSVRRRSTSILGLDAFTPDAEIPDL
jgi:hypothetical protein